MVYVLNQNGKPLMPTKRHGKVKRMLKNGQARIVKRDPFTVQLLYCTTGYTQPIALGVDAGSKAIGLSATTGSEEVYAAEVALRNDIVGLLSTRRELRQSRRNRKTRYRKARFNNRIHSKSKGWLAPSIENKIDTHLKAVRDIYKILLITEIIVETASFDIQKIKNPDISGAEYQQGEQLDFWNAREYVLFRDGHKCHGKKGCKNHILNVHHIESRKTGSDSPSNLITLCEVCHNAYHNGTLKLNLRRGQSFRDAAFMGIMRWAFYDKLKALYPNVSMTYGYITKHTRIRNGLQKSHCVDALCISGNPLAAPLGYFYRQKAVRAHNRQIHKATINKGGYRKLNQAPTYVHGYKLFDKVKMPDGREGFVFGRRTSGYFDIRTIGGEKLSAGISSKKITKINDGGTVLTERVVR
jgi:5-methylcytosine-specific restriction endonuclease McrA